VAFFVFAFLVIVSERHITFVQVVVPSDCPTPEEVIPTRKTKGDDKEANIQEEGADASVEEVMKGTTQEDPEPSKAC
jgi:hypothetical protein